MSLCSCVEAKTPRDRRSDGNRGAGGRGLPNGNFGGLFGASRRLVSAIDNMGFPSSGGVRIRGPLWNTSGRFLEVTTLFFLFSSSSSVMDNREYCAALTCRCGCRGNGGLFKGKPVKASSDNSFGSSIRIASR